MTDRQNEIAENMKRLKYSVVIPVYNSHRIVGTTIDKAVEFFQSCDLDYEIICVNDHSPDTSFQVIEQKAKSNPNVIAIDLLRNYGQHTANLCGFKHATGDYVITMDDDMQNPPDQIVHLINKASEGHDVVMGQFDKKKHAAYRCWGSKFIGYVNRKVFLQHEGLILSNFRIIRKDVVERICGYRTSYPYITGLVIMFASNPANVPVVHQERPVGKSNYSLSKIAKLVTRILFNYSSFPLRVVATIGMVISALSFLIGMFYLCKRLFTSVSVPGWTTLIVLMAFFNGITLLMLGMLGEYLVRLINHTCYEVPYHIREVVRKDE